MLVAAGVARSAPAALRLTATSPAEVRFEVDVPEARLSPLPDDPATLLLTFEGYEPGGPVGAPGLPARTVMVALPPTGEVSVRGVASETSSREGVLLAPVPDIAREGGRVSPVYQRSDEAYARSAPAAPEAARLIGVGWLRNQRVASVQVLPAEYDAAARRLTTARRVEVVVTVTPSAPVVTPAERTDPFERVYARVLVNYEQGKLWRRAAGRAGVEALMAGEGGPGRAGPARPFAVKAGTPVYAGRQWVKLAITGPGVYRVDFGTLRNLRPFSGGAVIDTSQIRLFTWRSPLPVLPEGDYCDTCNYHEVPIAFVSDSVFTDANANYFYFFAMGPSDWANLYDPSRPDTSYFNHPYETKNYYYLTVSTPAQPIVGPTLRIPLAPADVDTSGTPFVPTSFPERIHYEQSNAYFPDSPPVPNGTRNASGTVDSLSWQKWFWATLGRGQATQVQGDLPGWDTSPNVRLRMKVWGLVRSLAPLCGFVQNALDVSLNGTALPRVQWYAKESVTYDLTLPSPAPTGNTVALSSPIIGINSCSRVALAWIDLFYPRKLEPVSDSLTFVTPAGTGRAVYRIGPFTSATPPRLFDITDSFAPVEISGFHYQVFDATHYQLAFATDGVALRRYHVVPDSKIPRLIGASVFEAPRTSLFDLRQLKADYIVIYYDGFGAAAESLAAWRHYHLPLEGVSAPYDTATVPISAVFDQFSGGRTDPLATRNFLRAVFLEQGGGVPGSTRKPSFVTFLGDASYDYKNLLRKAAPGQPGCLLPTYENGYDAFVLGGFQFTTDDWLLNVDNASRIIPDFFGGRIPAGDATTAMDIVRNKVLFYDRQTPFGEYRNRVMLIADDNMQCKDPDVIGWGHLLQTGALDDQHTPPHIDRAYVYLHNYPLGAASCTKPAAKAEIRSNLLEGVAIFNYIGHGSPFQIADEAVMIETDIGTLTNRPRYPLFVAASCDVGLFNDPTQTSLGEKMVTTIGGGTIAVISSTQLATSFSNAQLNGYIYDQLFDRDPARGGQYQTGLAEALLIGKESAAGFGSLTNDMKYQLMGDAGTRLNLPRLWVELGFQDTLANPITQVARGQTVQFAGLVLDRPGGNPVVLDGSASVLIEDSAPLVSPPGFPSASYRYRAGPVYRADVAVAGGTLKGRVVMPLEAREGTLGRVRAYVTGRAPGQAVDTDAVGSTATTIVTGVAPPGDNEGPRIALSFAGGALEVRPDAVLNVDMYDPSGILITGHSPQNGIIVTVDENSTTRVDITPSFRYAANSYQGGRATFQLPNLALGYHRVKVSAADNLASGFAASAHRSSAVIDFKVVPIGRLNVTHAYLFPDPTSSTGAGPGGQFVVDAPGAAMNVLLRIYTVSGKLVRTLRTLGGFNQVQLEWDGLDDEGEALANGVYLFRVNVNATEPDGSSSAKEHAVAEGRFVVLNR